MSDQSISSTTQAFLDIYDITNDLVILKDGGAALILTVDALNFGLLAEEEQDAIIYSYAGLLNSLNYNVQILIRSQTKDVTGYLKLLEEQELSTPERDKKQQINQYRRFVNNLIRERNVLDKKFYVVIPATPIDLGLMTVQSVLPGVKQTDASLLDRAVILEKAKQNLEPKRDHLMAQFGRIGLFARQLQTQEIIQLFYAAYNPEAGEGQQLTDSSSYTTPVVQASIQGTTVMFDQNANLGNQTTAINPQSIETTSQASIQQSINPAPNQSTAAQIIAANGGVNASEQPISQPIPSVPMQVEETQPNEIQQTNVSEATATSIPNTTNIAPSMDVNTPAIPSINSLPTDSFSPQPDAAEAQNAINSIIPNLDVNTTSSLDQPTEATPLAMPVAPQPIAPLVSEQSNQSNMDINVSSATSNPNSSPTDINNNMPQPVNVFSETPTSQPAINSQPNPEPLTAPDLNSELNTPLPTTPTPPAVTGQLPTAENNQSNNYQSAIPNI